MVHSPSPGEIGNILLKWKLLVCQIAFVATSDLQITFQNILIYLFSFN